MKKLTPRQNIVRQRRSLDIWQDFIDWARTHPSPRWVFRGHRQKWTLRPTVGRQESYSLARELQLFEEFKRVGLPHVQNGKMTDDWDWLFIAQHHGLPTRLLDWTFNPLVAAFFACEGSATGKRDGEIIAVRIDDVGLLAGGDRDASPFDIETDRFLYPAVVAPRIGSQRGLFSIHPAPAKAWRLAGKTDRFTLPGEIKPFLQDYLYGMGIDSAMIMADLDGVARNLSWRYTNRKPLQ
jgi:hypothetical protein